MDKETNGKGWKRVQKHEKRLCKLNAIFQTLDKDNNGRIGCEELQQFLLQLYGKASLSEIEQLVSKFDSDSDGELNSQDFIRMISEGAKEQTKEDLVSNLFDLFDRDNDGLISRQDFSDLMQSMGENINEEELDSVFEIFDESKDGNIDMAEFSNVMIEGDEFQIAYIF